MMVTVVTGGWCRKNNIFRCFVFTTWRRADTSIISTKMYYRGEFRIDNISPQFIENNTIQHLHYSEKHCQSKLELYK